VLRQLVESRGLVDPTTTVTIRIADQTPGLDEKLTVRIDGLESVLVCPATQGSCDFVLADIPDTIEAIQEQRFDQDGGYQGGRVFEGQTGFSFDRSDYGAGSVILFLLGDQNGTVQVL